MTGIQSRPQLLHKPGPFVRPLLLLFYLVDCPPSCLCLITPFPLWSNASTASSSPSHALLLSGTAPAGHGHGSGTRQELPGRKLCLQFHPVGEGVPLFSALLLVHQRDPRLTDYERVDQVDQFSLFLYWLLLCDFSQLLFY